MAIQLYVGGIHFPTKLKLTSYVREMIARYPLGTQVTKQDQAFLESLFLHHPDAKRKLNAGVEKIEVRLDEYGKKHFYMYDKEGNGEDISWTKCVNNAR